MTLKIRTDFVTNSSSSSFVLEIGLELTDGGYISFNANGGTGETGRVDYFNCDALVTVSPKQLGTAQSVGELIQLLKDGVVDHYWEENEKIFEASKPVVSDSTGWTYDAYDFIKEIEASITSMDDIEKITISGNEYNYVNYCRSYTYNRVTGEYYGCVEGEEFEKDGSSGGDLRFDTSGCNIEYSGVEDEDEETFNVDDEASDDADEELPTVLHFAEDDEEDEEEYEAPVFGSQVTLSAEQETAHAKYNAKKKRSLIVGVILGAIVVAVLVSLVFACDSLLPDLMTR